MIKFDKFLSDSAFDFSENRKSVISEDIYKKIIKENRSFAIILSKSRNDLICMMENITNRKFYSVILNGKSGIHNGIILVQKNQERESDFKNSINEIYEKTNKNVGIIYRGTNSLKIIKEYLLEVYGIEKQNLQFFDDNASRILGCDTKIVGIEIPLDETLIKKYRSLGYLIPSTIISENNVSWKNIISQ